MFVFSYRGHESESMKKCFKIRRNACKQHLRLFTFFFTKIVIFTKRDVWDVIASYPTAVRPCSLALAAIPVTQVSVVRLFSAMWLLLSDLRSRLKQDAVEAMLLLLLRTNMIWIWSEEINDPAAGILFIWGGGGRSDQAGMSGIRIFRPKEWKPKSIGNVTFLFFRLGGGDSLDY